MGERYPRYYDVKPPPAHPFYPPPHNHHPPPHNHHPPPHNHHPFDQPPPHYPPQHDNYPRWQEPRPYDREKDNIRDPRREDKRDERRGEWRGDNHHSYGRDDGRDKKREHYKQDRDDRIKRPREDKFDEFTPKDALELNMKLQLKIKGLKEELNRYRGEVEHLRKLADSEHQENLKLKREVTDLEDDLNGAKNQIKKERSQHEIIFKENEQLINKLESEVIRLRMMCPPIMPPVMPMMGIPPMDTLPLKVKEGIAIHADRCVWVSTTSMPTEELAQVLGGPSMVDSIFINPRTSSAFILFHTVEKAVEGVAAARTILCDRSGIKCNVVNSSIWVGNVHCDEAELRALFGSVGEIDHVKMMNSSHCAFITYTSTMAAITACCELDGSILASLRISLNFKWYHVRGQTADLPGSVPHVPVCNVLYVGELDLTASREEITGMFATYGDVQDLWIGRETDYAFVTFASVEEAVVAKYHLQGRRLGAKTLRINFRKGVEVKEVLSESVTIRTVPPLADEEKLRGYVTKYGKISFMSKSKGGPDEWIVAMSTTEEAIILKGHLHSRTVGGYQFSVEYLTSKVKPEAQV